MRGIISAENLVQNGTAGDNGTDGGTQYCDFWEDETPSGRHLPGNITKFRDDVGSTPPQYQ